MLTAEQMKSIKIELGSIEKKQLTASLKANGILKVPNQNKANATASLGRSYQIHFGANRKYG
jgi:cobalt-zinc-cadmium efflux system membrane fusion protein